MQGVESRPATSRSIRRPAVAAVAASLLALAMAGPAGAATILHDHYSDDYAFSHDDCGFTVDVAGHDEGVAHLRVGKGDLGTAFFLHDNYSFLETWTRHDTGAWIAIGGNGLFNETKAVPVPGAEPFTFAFTSINAGQPFTVWDSDGNVIVRDRGVIQQVIQFNTNGDDVPGGEFVADVSFSVAGPHPGLDLDVCTLLD
jgi:hypothetical protein